MGIEVADRHADDTDTRLDQSTGEQELQGTLGTLAGRKSFHSVRGRRVTSERLGGFLAEVHRRGEAAGGENADGLLGEAVHRVHHPAGVGLTPDAIKPGTRTWTVGETVDLAFPLALPEELELEGGELIAIRLGLASGTSIFAPAVDADVAEAASRILEEEVQKAPVPRRRRRGR